MGIRFYCPNGHKLNVKTFLAGQRGICPKCGAKVDIPFESTREKGSKDLPIAAEWEERARREGLYPFSQAGAAAEDINLNAVHGGTVGGTVQGAVQADLFSAQNAEPDDIFAAVVASQAAPAPFSQPASPDPVDEAPDAVWYVRPTSGEQFGPVKGDVVKQWLAEKRIQADTLVWREGWSEWQTAGKVFPSLGGGWNFG